MTFFYSSTEQKWLIPVKCSDDKFRTPERAELFEQGLLKEEWCALRQIWVEVEVDAPW